DDHAVLGPIAHAARDLEEGKQLVHSRERKIEEPTHVLVVEEGAALRERAQLGAVAPTKRLEVLAGVYLDHFQIPRWAKAGQQVKKGVRRIRRHQRQSAFRLRLGEPDGGRGGAGGFAGAAFSPEQNQTQRAIAEKTRQNRACRRALVPNSHARACSLARPSLA